MSSWIKNIFKKFDNQGKMALDLVEPWDDISETNSEVKVTN